MNNIALTSEYLMNGVQWFGEVTYCLVQNQRLKEYIISLVLPYVQM